MRGADARQSALSGNLANVDTPGYLRKDVDFQDTLQAAVGAGTDPGNVAFTAQTDSSAPVREDGNSVDIDRENAELSENALDYDALARVASTRIDILKTAMGVAQ